jgi:hypothetical protein
MLKAQATDNMNTSIDMMQAHRQHNYQLLTDGKVPSEGHWFRSF